jgi:hypothetical protein
MFYEQAPGGPEGEHPEGLVDSIPGMEDQPDRSGSIEHGKPVILDPDKMTPAGRENARIRGEQMAQIGEAIAKQDEERAAQRPEVDDDTTGLINEVPGFKPENPQT